MANMGGFVMSEIKKLQKSLNDLQENNQIDAFVEKCAKVLAAKLLARVKKRTPVGIYSGNAYVCETGYSHKGSKMHGEDSGTKVGGTLRNGWTVEKIKKEGDKYKIEVSNSIEYASYVEYGHRTVNHRGWVPGHFMMTISEQEIERISPSVLEDRIKKFLGGAFR